MAQDSFIHNTDPDFINRPKGENLTIFRNSDIPLTPPDPSAPYQVMHPDGTLEPLGGGGTGGGVLILGDIDVSTPQLYPAASEGDAYRIVISNPALETGLIGGAAGIQVERFDIIYAVATNAGGTQAAVGTSWTIWEGERFQLWVHGDPSVQGAILQNNIPTPNTSLSAFTVVMGGDNSIGILSDNSVVTGSGNTITATVGGSENFMTGVDNIIQGPTVIANIVGGSSNEINASESAANNNLVEGAGNTITDGSNNIVSGSSNTVEAGSNRNIASGLSNDISANSSDNIVNGLSNTVDINSSRNIVQGQTNIVNATSDSLITGQLNESLAVVGVQAKGTLSRADQDYKSVHASGTVLTGLAGASQGEDLPGFVQTIGAVSGTLLDFTLPSDTALQVTGNIVVSRHIAGAGAIGDSSGVFFTALVKNVAGVMTLVNSTGAVMVGEIIGATVTFGVSATGLTITANGIATDTLNWSVYAKSARVAFNNYV